MLKKFDDFLIDSLFQKLVNIVGVNPFYLSYYLWGITMTLAIAVIASFHYYLLIFFVIACMLNMVNCYFMKDMKMMANPFRYNDFALATRTFIFFLGVITLLPPFSLQQIVMSVFWISAVYVSCCSAPPPKKAKQKRTFGKEVFAS